MASYFQTAPSRPLSTGPVYTYCILHHHLPQLGSSRYPLRVLVGYINAGKPPEPFYANVDVLTGDKTVLHTLKFTKCSAIDFDWYYQEFIFFPTLTGVPNPETRERYTLYCEGLTVAVP